MLNGLTISKPSMLEYPKSSVYKVWTLASKQDATIIESQWDRLKRFIRSCALFSILVDRITMIEKDEDVAAVWQVILNGGAK
jgi:hypothetical protein